MCSSHMTCVAFDGLMSVANLVACPAVSYLISTPIGVGSDVPRRARVRIGFLAALPGFDLRCEHVKLHCVLHDCVGNFSLGGRNCAVFHSVARFARREGKIVSFLCPGRGGGESDAAVT